MSAVPAMSRMRLRLSGRFSTLQRCVKLYSVGGGGQQIQAPDIRKLAKMAQIAVSDEQVGGTFG
jgi:hypothetical protein